MLVFISRLPPLSDANRLDGPYALIMAPTRELAVQIFDEARKVRAGCLCCARDEARRPWLTLAWFLGM